MSISVGEKLICKYNLRGMCRFGKRCRNVHEDPEVLVEKMIGITTRSRTPSPDRSDQLEGACALTPTKDKKVVNNNNSPKPGTSQLCDDLEDRTCGICFEIILKKDNRRDQIFGLLPNCSHVFCFSCIRKWRQSKEFDFEVSKACPECRIASDFVYPTKHWIDDKDAKEKYITRQKERMKKVNCKYFRQGKGKCPFGNTCLYLHALPSGTVINVGPPKPRRRSAGVSGEDLVHQILFWLNDDDFDTDDSDDDDDIEFELDFDDPCIALQYYERGDIRRYMAWERLMNGCDSDNGDDDIPVFLL